MDKTDFTRDRKSGFINILGLIGTDIHEMCGSSGTLISVSIENLRNINAAHGRHHGDIYVHDLILTLQESLASIRLRYQKAVAIRISPNEYVLMLPNMPESEAVPIARILKARYRDLVLEQNMPESTLSAHHVAYQQSIPHLSHLLKWSNRVMTTPGYTSILQFDESDWTDTLIERSLDSFSETLDLLREADRLSLSDDISKLPNHRAANACLNRLFQQYKTCHRHFSILFLDGDNLRRYNEMGYAHGNRMIEDMARFILHSLREQDQVFRWLSGDEFLVCLPDTDMTTAARIGERIRTHVESATLDWPMPVTISVGVASCPQDGVNPETLVHRAERANALAKDNGKNCVVCSAAV